MNKVSITIVTSGELATGKTRAINLMVAALKDEFEIVDQYPKQDSIGGIEVYTFKARLR